jgi:hypothetical protein
MRKKIFERLPNDDNQESICINCIEDECLQRFFTNQFPEFCHVCKKDDSPTVSLPVLANAARSIIREHFRLVSVHDPAVEQKLNLSDVLSAITKVTDIRFCSLMAAYLSDHPRHGEDGFFSPGQKYLQTELLIQRQNGQRDALLIWNEVALDLLHRQRFFNKKAEKFFEVLFDEAVKAKSNSLFGEQSSAVKMVLPNKVLFRARRLDNVDDKDQIAGNPSKELGAPPKIRAAQNRMNPPGIPLFYSAADLETAIAEIRPSINDEVAIGKFKTTRTLKFFNFCGLNIFPIRSKLSYWYDDYELRLHCRELLNYLHRAVSQPVRIGETGYVVTQAMTEYLCHRNEERFDGIIFSSVQNKGGVNYVIFSDQTSGSLNANDDSEPKFPVEFDGSPMFHRVSQVKYGGDWLDRVTGAKAAYDV